MKSFLVLATLAFAFAVDLHASPKVQFVKVRGQRAIVKLPKDFKPEKGEIFFLSVDDPDEKLDTQLPTDKHPRTNRLGFEFSFSDLSTETDGVDEAEDSTIMSLSILYGWNFGDYEVGPIIEFTNTDETDSKSNSIGLGGFGEYNFRINDFTQKMVPSVGMSLVFHSGSSEQAGSSELDFTEFDIELYGAVKLFPWGGGLALIPKLGYQQTSRETSAPGSTISSDTSGFVITMGLSGYLENVFEGLANM